ncbi:MAG: hypothetical protein JNJ70_12775 [Verrucomicrobiales bacterium]|nr:hypothetical protein [Verrucomicrobiales bacterium]
MLRLRIADSLRGPDLSIGQHWHQQEPGVDDAETVSIALEGPHYNESGSEKGIVFSEVRKAGIQSRQEGRERSE